MFLISQNDDTPSGYSAIQSAPKAGLRLDTQFPQFSLDRDFGCFERDEPVFVHDCERYFGNVERRTAFGAVENDNGVVTYKRIYGDWTDSRAKK